MEAASAQLGELESRHKLVKVNQSTDKLGYRFEADSNFIYVSTGYTELGFDREGAQRFIAQFIEWLSDTAKAPPLASKICSLCIRVKEMTRNHEPFTVDQRIEFMQHLRDVHKIEEYAPEV